MQNKTSRRLSIRIEIIPSVTPVQLPAKRRKYRKGYKRLAPLEMAAKIRELHRNTDMTQHAIAAVFGINQGIVSMVLAGKLYPETNETMH